VSSEWAPKKEEKEKENEVINIHLEQAETGLETLNSGVSAALGPDLCIIAITLPLSLYI
jgi:hypothetical protein